MHIEIDGEIYVPASTLKEGPTGVRYIMAVGVTDLQCEQGRNSELYQHGDMRLVWVNEGDLYAFWNKVPNKSKLSSGESEA